MARILRPFVAEAVVFNPMATKAIASAKIKTDKVDAPVLAQLLRCGYLPRVWEPDETTQKLHELTGRRAALIGERTAARNRIHSTLAMRLIPEPRESRFESRGREWLVSGPWGRDQRPQFPPPNPHPLPSSLWFRRERS